MTRKRGCTGIFTLVGASLTLSLQSAPLRADCKSTGVLNPGDHNYTLEFEGVMHEVIVHLPPSYDGHKPMPVLFDLHGSGSDAGQQLLFSGSPDVADKSGFIVVAPTGFMGSWNGDIAFGEAYARMLNDVGFMKSLVAYVAGLVNIDHRRVYATGLSNGGAMSNTLGCQAADIFAGIAPVADPLDIGLPTCKPVQPIAVLGFHGYSDDAVPYEGGRGNGPELPTPFPSIPDTLKAWGRLMGCVKEPELLAFQGKNKCEIYRMCGRDVQVGYCSIEGDHLLYWQDSINISQYAWDFLSQFALPLPDVDNDGISDQDDNCPYVANADQADQNGNCVGDVCECRGNNDCNDGVFCNGEEVCQDQRCQLGSPACAASESCDERARACASGQAAERSGTAGQAGSLAAAGHSGAAARERPPSSPSSRGTGERSQAETGAIAGATAIGPTTAGAGASAALVSGPSAVVGKEPKAARRSGCTVVGSPRHSFRRALFVLALGLLLPVRRRIRLGARKR